MAAVCILLGATAAMTQPSLSVDPTFQTQIQWYYVSDLEFLPDGKVLVSGELNFPGMLSPPFRGLARLNPDGTLDNSFTGTAGGGQISPWSSYYYVGLGQSVRRIFQSGVIDQSFDGQAPLGNALGGEHFVLQDGTVLLSGLYDLRDTASGVIYQYKTCLTKLDLNGQPDTSFAHRSCSSGIVRRIRPTPDGKFLLSGSQLNYDGHAVGRVLRIYPDGSLDTTFLNSFHGGHANDFYFYPDGRILVGGYFTLPEYPNDTLELMRLMPDGSVDMSWPVMNFRIDGTFFADIAPVGGIFEVELGKLMLTGQFKELNGEEVGGIVMIDTAGTVLQHYFTGLGCDTLISPPSIVTREVYRTERAPDGSLYIYGSYHGFDDGYNYHQDQRLITKLYPLNAGVEEQQAESSRQLAVWPNPAQGLLNVQLPEGLRSGLLRVMDATGRVVQQERFPAFVSSFSFPLSAFSPGLYTVQLIDPQAGPWLAKWIKE